MTTHKSTKLPQTLRIILSWIVTLLVPVVLILTAVRLLITPAFVIVEYNMPGFPPDRYGFTKEDRLYWAQIAADYLVNDEDISFLADLHFPNGATTPPETCQFMDDCTLVYNERELQHMVDVKNVVQSAQNVWLISLVVLVGLALWAWLGNWVWDYTVGLGRGGWLTVIIVASLLLLVIMAFGLIFVEFHNVFFEPGTWRFYYSDTLIRLFPERFWRDTFLAVGLMAGGAGFVIGYFLGRKKKTE